MTRSRAAQGTSGAAKDRSNWKKKKRLEAGVPDVTADQEFLLPLPEYGPHEAWAKTSLFLPRQLHQTLSAFATLERTRRLQGTTLEGESTGEMSELIRRLLVFSLGIMGLDWRRPTSVLGWREWVERGAGAERLDVALADYEEGLKTAAAREAKKPPEDPT